MRTLLVIALTIGVFSEAFGAVFKFKDNTVVNANIYDPSSDMPWEKVYGPNKDGVILKVNNKFYIHHYPAYHKKVDNGRYYEPIPEPPTNIIAHNPERLPVCVPSRIKFMHFSTETLKNMYFHYHEKVRTEMYKPNPDKNKISKDKEVALAIHKAIYNKNYKLNNNFKTLAWERKVISEFTGHKNVIWGKYIHERHHFSRR